MKVAFLSCGDLKVAFLNLGGHEGGLPELQREERASRRLTREPVRNYVAFAFCVLITLFTIFFGSRHIATREKHEGLVFAIAFESVIKLVAIGGIGLYALYGVFDGPQSLEQWLLQNQSALAALHTPLQEGPWRTLLLVFFVAGLLLLSKLPTQTTRT